jgi:signal transduction histidine kinase
MSQAGSDIKAKDGPLLPARIRDAQRSTLLLSFGLLSILLALLLCLQPLASAEKLDSAQPAAQSSTPNVAAQASMQQPAAISSQPLESRLPFYQTWYFYLALLFLGITLPVQIFRRRMLLMKGRIGIVVEERNRISRECHDTLMAGFAAISWQLEATAKLFRDSGLESTPAAESCELARSMVSHCQAEARRIIWDLRETDEVTSILSQALTRSLAANHVQGRTQTTLEVEGEEIPLAPGCVHHLVCIGQEAVNNAMRHAGASRILVHVKYASDALFLSVRDDGSGFQPSYRSSSRYGHFGIAVMQERVRKIGGVFRIHSLDDSGTEVAVEVPFNATEELVHQGQNVIRWIGI